MSNAVTPAVEQSRALVPVPPARQQSMTLAEISAFAKEAYLSGAYGESLKNAAQGVIKIQTGHDMGLLATEALRHVYVVGNVPSFSAQFIAARIKQSRPRYNYSVVSLTNKGCTLRFWEDGQKVGEFSFDENDAKLAGLLPSKDARSPWVKWPRSMYFSRAVTGGARVYCPDILGAGIAPYTPEELGGDVAPEDVTDAEFTVKK